MSTRLKFIAVFAAAAILMAEASFAQSSVQLAQDSCFDAGQRYAMQSGARLVTARAATKDGTPVCEVVVLTQSSNGGRPKREVVYLPK